MTVDAPPHARWVTAWADAVALVHRERSNGNHAEAVTALQRAHAVAVKHLPPEAARELDNYAHGIIYNTGPVAEAGLRSRSHALEFILGLPDVVDRPTSVLFRRWSMDELRGLVSSEVQWLTRGVAIRPTYGQVAGEMKTLKTLLATLFELAVASGTKFLDRWIVDTRGPVVVYVGEGGRDPWFRRADRVANAMGLCLDDLPIEVSFDVAPIDSLRFTESLVRDLDELHPELVVVDPLYAFHGTKSDSKDLHQEGALLTSFSSPCMDAGVTSYIVNHFNQSGSGNGLKRITQAGSGEWVDSWMLTSHREDPDVARGRFKLRLDIGSRQWGGTSWDLDLELGTFDEERGEHVGNITWDLRAAGKGSDAPLDRIIAAVIEQPGELSKEELAKRAGVSLKRARELVEHATEKTLIRPQLVEVVRSNGRRDRQWHYFPIEPTSNDGRTETEQL